MSIFIFMQVLLVSSHEVKEGMEVTLHSTPLGFTDFRHIYKVNKRNLISSPSEKGLVAENRDGAFDIQGKRHGLYAIFRSSESRDVWIKYNRQVID